MKKFTKNKILICFGTRPEYLKIKPLINNLDKSKFSLAYLHQHKNIKEHFIYDYFVKIPELKKNNRLNDIIINTLKNFPNLNNYRYVLVQGDTTAALSSAICAFNNKTDIIHLEAGLRSFDLFSPYPEEANRKLISNLAKIHFAPTNLSKKNIFKENIKKNIFITGNTSLDNLLSYKKKCFYGNKILITLHRREKLEELDQWLCRLDELASKNKSLEFIFPIHPNPLIKKISSKFSHLKKIKHLNHSELLDILYQCKLVITDSGGIQEEASFFNKKVIVCRDVTERPEGIKSGHLIMCDNYKKIGVTFNKVLKNYKISKTCPYGDGCSGSRISKILKKLL